MSNSTSQSTLDLVFAPNKRVNFISQLDSEQGVM